MKKTLTSLLSLLALSSLFMFSSCQKETVGNGTQFRATMEGCTSKDGKTALNGTALNWVAGDEIAVYGTAGRGIYTATPQTPATVALFDNVSGETGDAPFRAYYPTTLTTDGIHVTLPAVQTTADGSLTEFPMYAQSGDNTLAFRNLCGALKLHLTKAGVSVSSIEVSTNTPINGQYTLRYTGVPVIDYESDGTNSTVLECENPQPIANGKDFYIYLPHGNYTDVEFTITATDGSVCTKHSKANVAIYITRSQYTTINLGENELVFVDPEELRQEVISNAEKVMDNVGSIFKYSETIEAMAAHLGEIKTMANVEDAWQDGEAICVKIKDGGVIMWSYYQEVNSTVDTTILDPLINRLQWALPLSKDGAICSEKSICILNAFDDSFEPNKTLLYNIIRRELYNLGWKTSIIERSKVTPHFIVNNISKYGMTIIGTHGGYFDRRHWLLTGMPWKEMKKSGEWDIWKEDNVRLNYVKRSDLLNAYVLISETYFQDYLLDNFPNNSIMFLDACSTLEDNDNLWQILRNKGLGCMVGYTKSIYSNGANSCLAAFIDALSCSSTTGEACRIANTYMPLIERTQFGLELKCCPENSDIIIVESPDDPDWVDLGLPSGLLWATRNVGATSPEDYGDYFAWGETTPKSYYDWSTYIYCNGDSRSLTKYCNNSSYGYNGFTDNLTILQPSDDAATANYGGRTPTKEEWEELRDNTTAIWTTQNGVNGRLFTGTNGNSLFLPAAGDRVHSSHGDAGNGGVYLSSSLPTSNPISEWMFFFGSSYHSVSSAGRFYGTPVRAVRSAE